MSTQTDDDILGGVQTNVALQKALVWALFFGRRRSRSRSSPSAIVGGRVGCARAPGGSRRPRNGASGARPRRCGVSAPAGARRRHFAGHKRHVTLRSTYALPKSRASPFGYRLVTDDLCNAHADFAPTRNCNWDYIRVRFSSETVRLMAASISMTAEASDLKRRNSRPLNRFLSIRTKIAISSYEADD